MGESGISCARVVGNAGGKYPDQQGNRPGTCGNHVHRLWTQRKSPNGNAPVNFRWPAPGVSVRYVMTVSAISGLPPDVEVRRSTRRRRTVSAYRDGGRTVVVVPARMSERDIRAYVTDLLAQLSAREQRAHRTDDELHGRALQLLTAYLPGGAEPLSVRWVSNQHERWGSCTTTDRSIRLSDRLQGMPDYVVDYVLLHEIAHLQVAGHGADFEALLSGYADVGRARAFLDGVTFTRRSPSAAPETPVARRQAVARQKRPDTDAPGLF